MVTSKNKTGGQTRQQDGYPWLTRIARIRAYSALLDALR